MAIGIDLHCDPLRTLAAGSIVAGYTPIGTPFTRTGRILLVQNFTNEALMFSFDGVNDHFPLQKNSSFIIDVTSNQWGTNGYSLAIGTHMNVKRIGVATTGSVYVTLFYARGV